MAQGSIPQCAVRNEPLAAKKRKTRHPGRRLVRVTSFRIRSVDPDNLCAKWFIDALRYAGILYDDTAEDIDYQISQEKVKQGEDRTEIEITYP